MAYGLSRLVAIRYSPFAIRHAKNGHIHHDWQTWPLVLYYPQPRQLSIQLVGLAVGVVPLTPAGGVFYSVTSSILDQNSIVKPEYRPDTLPVDPDFGCIPQHWLE
jgi:hypothetical protein